MRKICFIISLFIVTGFTFPDISNATDLKTLALTKLQEAVVKELPVNTGVIRIAVLDPDGDDGTVKKTLISAITRKPPLRIMEREDLDQILKEQGFQLKDIMDESTRVQQGGIRGVQGLLMGKVLKMGGGFLSYTIKVHLKLDDVEKGEILFSRDFDITVQSPQRKQIIMSGASFFLILIFLFFIIRGRKRGKEKKIAEDVNKRMELTRELVKALTNISDAKARLMDKGKTEDAVLFKDVERELRLLKEQVENASQGSADMRSKGELKQTVKFDKKISDSFTQLTASTNRLYDKVTSGGSDHFEKDMSDLKRDIKNTGNRFRDRR